MVMKQDLEAILLRKMKTYLRGWYLSWCLKYELTIKKKGRKYIKAVRVVYQKPSGRKELDLVLRLSKGHAAGA